MIILDFLIRFWSRRGRITDCHSRKNELNKVTGTAESIQELKNATGLCELIENIK